MTVRQRSLLALLATVHVACGWHAAARQTVTHDEFWHLPVGLLHWRTGQFHYDVLNPPLTRLWGALPAAVAGVEADPGVDATDIARRFVHRHGAAAHRWYVWGRLANLGCSLATGLLLVRWAADWWGATGASLVALLFFTCPNVLAHSSLVTPDAGLMLGSTATLYLFERWRRSPTWGRTAALGLVLGLTQATKFTAVWLYPVLGVLGIGCPRPASAFSTSAAPAAPLRRQWGRALGQAGVVLLVSLFAWNASFLFEGTGRSLTQSPLQSRTLQTLRAALGPVAAWPLPWPADYIAGLDRQKAVMEQPHPCYLDGRWSTTGFWDYFLWTLAYKLPHVFQLASLLGLVVLLGARGMADRRAKLLVLFVPLVSLLAMASFSVLQLGIRYVLPVLPLLALLAGGAGQWLDRCRPALRRAALILLTGLALASLRYQPHHLAYFNELAGGPVGGRHHLLDSNLDWGQDLYLVKEFMEAHQLDRIGLVYYGTWPVELSGIDFEISPGFAPRPGWHAVSVNYVMGRPHLLREPDGRTRPADLFEFAYFQQFEPVARLGYSIDVYHIEAPAAGR
jgi:hypothetical protein